MKLSLPNSLLAVTFAVATASAHADAYLSKDYGTHLDRIFYSTDMPDANHMFTHQFNLLQQGLGSFVNPQKDFLGKNIYIGLSGQIKRADVFTIQIKQDRNSIKDLTLPSKLEAKDFCQRMIAAAYQIETHKVLSTQTIFASDWYDASGSKQRAIAVNYSVPYKGEYAGTLRPANKLFICPNPLGVKLDTRIEDENESTGIMASGFHDHTFAGIHTENGTYHVACINSNIAETDFDFHGAFWVERNKGYPILNSPKHDSLDYVDAALGSPYCAGKTGIL